MKNKLITKKMTLQSFRFLQDLTNRQTSLNLQYCHQLKFSS